MAKQKQELNTLQLHSVSEKGFTVFTTGFTGSLSLEDPNTFCIHLNIAK